MAVGIRRRWTLCLALALGGDGVVGMGQQAGVLEGICLLGGAAERPGGRLTHRLVPGGGGAV